MKTRRTDGADIRKRRTEAGRSRHAFARDTGISLSYLKNIENDGYQPSDRILRIIAAHLGCTLDDISAPLPGRAAA